MYEMNEENNVFKEEKENTELTYIDEEPVSEPSDDLDETESNNGFLNGLLAVGAAVVTVFVGTKLYKRIKNKNPDEKKLSREERMEEKYKEKLRKQGWIEPASEETVIDVESNEDDEE